ncbi:MAG: hypothetical protein KAR55_02155, partial [Thermoplasmatales archaeon]|nr:hypothetical protein [Thermoplasmatales archaeon]
MKGKNVNKKITRLVVLSILVIFLTTSANSAFVNNSGDDDPPVAPLGQNYYEWKDDFNNEQNIDISKSWGYELSGGKAKMKYTCSFWTEPEWEKMMP